MKKYPHTLIFGASGNIGGKIAQLLLENDAPVGVVGRSSDRLRAFAGRAAIWAGDFADDALLRKALQPAGSLFLTVPNEHLENPAATAERLGHLLQGSAVTHIVNISNSILKRGGQPTRLVAFEQELNKLPGLNILHLRCGNFFDNLNWGLHTPYLPDLRLPYVSSDEVAFVAANHLLRQDFNGIEVRSLLGARDYSMAELAAAAGETYVQQPYTPDNRLFYQPFNEGDFEVAPRTEANTSLAQHERFTLAYFLAHELVRPAPEAAAV
ncbi:NAD(P)H-binding protein [Pontibacter liquoris]|uniref:NAD(P)H-binding protein n=1 Tax=Pontibacter liquoris TaxID=2905677 RepID=UPI001FA7A1CD|nr:NAD(P)H-binding protein [Pontibacter liquoris]